MMIMKIDTNSKCVGNAWKDKNIGIYVPNGLNKTYQEKTNQFNKQKQAQDFHSLKRKTVNDGIKQTKF